MARMDSGSSGPMLGPTAEKIVRALRELAPVADLLVVSDYGYGVLTDGVIAGLRQVRPDLRAVLALDTKDYSGFAGLDVTFAKPNYRQALALLGTGANDHDRVAFIASNTDGLIEATGAALVAVTLDADGAVTFGRELAPYRTYAPAATGTPAGAGDTFLSAFALALAAEGSPPAAAEIATHAASIVVASERTAVCPASTLRESLTGASGRGATHW